MSIIAAIADENTQSGERIFPIFCTGFSTTNTSLQVEFSNHIGTVPSIVLTTAHTTRIFVSCLNNERGSSTDSVSSFPQPTFDI
ncbi:hypothetical protein CHS0354_040773 [Potamilus streckersoni]|uniref:Uncharacterized protein n=1 Tax=Potamilus streckersoni TaxID=2493646 RepID=A0AAE0SL21_9BIVA|nr:hypothetical protein CHS0354_040773 [Potamilus streckersoni]